jgi:acetoin utilization deacetylase AcuC-like enzyme
MVGFASSPRFTAHIPTRHHPERPDRIRAIYLALGGSGLLTSESPFPFFELALGTLRRFSEPLLEVPFASADPKWLLSVHPQSHIDRVRHVCTIGGGVLDSSGDTPVGPESFEVAMLAVGAVLGSCDAVMAGRVRRAFAAVRPPGHHAEPERAMGFCLFANVAIAARYLQQRQGVGKVAVVDFDVHHGNGTQAAFFDDPSVLFISIHQDPRTCYPGTGYDWEIGVGEGRGYTVNFPMPPGSGDEDYMKVMETLVLPELEEFAPEVLLLSAGFDAHSDDPLAEIELSEEGFERITRSLADAADRHCGGRVISVLEGGYNLRAMSRSVVRHLAGLGAC